ncbi:hypothetical protein SNEBB_001858 [Seison nebaliae]|nr:hypothetical protein SNEBB_001858 [Seison nebaliae]
MNDFKRELQSLRQELYAPKISPSNINTLVDRIIQLMMDNMNNDNCQLFVADLLNSKSSFLTFLQSHRQNREFVSSKRDALRLLSILLLRDSKRKGQIGLESMRAYVEELVKILFRSIMNESYADVQKASIDVLKIILNDMILKKYSVSHNQVHSMLNKIFQKLSTPSKLSGGVHNALYELIAIICHTSMEECQRYEVRAVSILRRMIPSKTSKSSSSDLSPISAFTTFHHLLITFPNIVNDRLIQSYVQLAIDQLTNRNNKSKLVISALDFFLNNVHLLEKYYCENYRELIGIGRSWRMNSNNLNIKNLSNRLLLHLFEWSTNHPDLIDENMLEYLRETAEKECLNNRNTTYYDQSIKFILLSYKILIKTKPDTLLRVNTLTILKQYQNKFNHLIHHQFENDDLNDLPINVLDSMTIEENLYSIKNYLENQEILIRILFQHQHLASQIEMKLILKQAENVILYFYEHSPKINESHTKKTIHRLLRLLRSIHEFDETLLETFIQQIFHRLIQCTSSLPTIFNDLSSEIELDDESNQSNDLIPKFYVTNYLPFWKYLLLHESYRRNLIEDEGEKTILNEKKMTLFQESEEDDTQTSEEDEEEGDDDDDVDDDNDDDDDDDDEKKLMKKKYYRDYLNNQFFLILLEFLKNLNIRLKNGELVSDVDQNDKKTFDQFTQSINSGVLSVGKEERVDDSIQSSYLEAENVVDQDFFYNSVHLLQLLVKENHLKIDEKWKKSYLQFIVSQLEESPYISSLYRLASIIRLESSTDIELMNLSKLILNESLNRSVVAKDDLLIQCLSVVHSLPIAILFEAKSASIQAIKLSLMKSNSYTPFITSILQTFHRWIDENWEMAKELFVEVRREIFNNFVQSKTDQTTQNDYLSQYISHADRNRNERLMKLRKNVEKSSSASSNVDNLSSQTNQVNQNEINRQIICLFGKIGQFSFDESINWEVDEENLEIWYSRNLLKFSMPFPDMKVELYLDSILPRTIQLLMMTNDNRRLKVAAAEFFHVLFTYIIGMISSHPNKNNHEYKNLVELFHNSFIIAIRLSNDADMMIGELFKETCRQTINWISFQSNGQQSSFFLNGIISQFMKLLHNKSFDESIEYRLIVIEHLSILFDRMLNDNVNHKSIDRIIDIIRNEIVSNDVNSRLYGIMILNRIIRTFTKSNRLIHVYLLDIIHRTVQCLAMNHELKLKSSNDMLIDNHTAIRHLAKICALNWRMFDEEIHPSVKEIRIRPAMWSVATNYVLLSWLFRQIGRFEYECRLASMRLFQSLIYFHKDISHQNFFEMKLKNCKNWSSFLLPRIEGISLNELKHFDNENISLKLFEETFIIGIGVFPDLSQFLNNYSSSLLNTFIKLSNETKSSIIIDENRKIEEDDGESVDQWLQLLSASIDSYTWIIMQKFLSVDQLFSDVLSNDSSVFWKSLNSFAFHFPQISDITQTNEYSKRLFGGIISRFLLLMHQSLLFGNRFQLKTLPINHNCQFISNLLEIMLFDYRRLSNHFSEEEEVNRLKFIEQFLSILVQRKQSEFVEVLKNNLGRMKFKKEKEEKKRIVEEYEESINLLKILRIFKKLKIRDGKVNVMELIDINSRCSLEKMRLFFKQLIFFDSQLIFQSNTKWKQIFRGNSIDIPINVNQEDFDDIISYPLLDFVKQSSAVVVENILDRMNQANPENFLKFFHLIIRNRQSFHDIDKRHRLGQLFYDHLSISLDHLRLILILNDNVLSTNEQQKEKYLKLFQDSLSADYIDDHRIILVLLPYFLKEIKLVDNLRLLRQYFVNKLEFSKILNNSHRQKELFNIILKTNDLLFMDLLVILFVSMTKTTITTANKDLNELSQFFQMIARKEENDRIFQYLNGNIRNLSLFQRTTDLTLSHEQQLIIFENISIPILINYSKRIRHKFFLDHISVITDEIDELSNRLKIKDDNDRFLTHLKLSIFLRLIQILFAFSSRDDCMGKESELVKIYISNQRKKPATVVGNELCKFLMQKCRAIRNEFLIDENSKIDRHRLFAYRCRTMALNTMISIISRTQTEQKFYCVFLFKEDLDRRTDLIFSQIIDEESIEIIPKVFHNRVEMKWSESFIEFESSKENEANINHKKYQRQLQYNERPFYLSSQYFHGTNEIPIEKNDKQLDNSLKQSIKQEPDIVKVKKEESEVKKASPNYFHQIQLEDVPWNHHESMAPFVVLIREILHGKIIQEKEEDEEIVNLLPPMWMNIFIQRFHKTIERNEKKIAQFLSQLTINCSSIFRRYSSTFLPVLYSVIANNQLGDELNTLIYDVVMETVEWNYPTDFNDNSIHQLLEWFLDHVVDEDRSITKNNLFLLEIFLRKWNGHLKKRTYHEKILNNFKKNENTIIFLQILHIFFSNHLHQSIFNELIYKRIMEIFSKTTSKVEYSLASELVGLMLNWLNEQNSLKSNEIILKKIDQHLLQIDSEKRFFECVERICSKFVKFFKIFPHDILRKTLKFFNRMQLECRHISLQIIPYLVDELTNEECYHNLLIDGQLEEFINLSDPKIQLTSLDLMAIIVEKLDMKLLIQSSSVLFKISQMSQTHSLVKLRSSSIRVLMIFYIKWKEWNEQRIDKDDSSSEDQLIYIIKSSLLISIRDKNEDIRNIIEQFWCGKQAALPQSSSERMLYVLEELYHPNCEKCFFFYSSNFVLNLCAQSGNYLSKLFHHQLTDEYYPINFNKNWKQRFSFTSTPTFISASQKSYNGRKKSSFISTQTQQLLHHKIKLDKFLNTQITETLSTNNKMDNFSLFTQMNARANELLMDEDKMKLGNVNDKWKTKHMITNTRDVYRRQSAVNIKKKNGRTTSKNQYHFARLTLRKQEKQLKLYQDERSEKENYAQFCRSYRSGDMPDISISSKDIIEPLIRLLREDEVIASEIFLKLFDSLIKEQKELLSKLEFHELMKKLSVSIFTSLASTNLFSYQFTTCLFQLFFSNLHQISPPIIDENDEESGAIAAIDAMYSAAITSKCLPYLIVVFEELLRSKKSERWRNVTHQILQTLSISYKQMGYHDSMLSSLYIYNQSSSSYHFSSLLLRGGEYESMNEYSAAISNYIEFTQTSSMRKYPKKSKLSQSNSQTVNIDIKYLQMQNYEKSNISWDDVSLFQWMYCEKRFVKCAELLGDWKILLKQSRRIIDELAEDDEDDDDDENKSILKVGWEKHSNPERLLPILLRNQLNDLLSEHKKSKIIDEFLTDLNSNDRKYIEHSSNTSILSLYKLFNGNDYVSSKMYLDESFQNYQLDLENENDLLSIVDIELFMETFIPTQLAIKKNEYVTAIIHLKKYLNYCRENWLRVRPSYRTENSSAYQYQDMYYRRRFFSLKCLEDLEECQTKNNMMVVNHVDNLENDLNEILMELQLRQIECAIVQKNVDLAASILKKFDLTNKIDDTMKNDLYKYQIEINLSKSTYQSINDVESFQLLKESSDLINKWDNQSKSIHQIEKKINKLKLLDHYRTFVMERQPNDDLKKQLKESLINGNKDEGELLELIENKSFELSKEIVTINNSNIFSQFHLLRYANRNILTIEHNLGDKVVLEESSEYIEFIDIFIRSFCQLCVQVKDHKEYYDELHSYSPRFIQFLQFPLVSELDQMKKEKKLKEIEETIFQNYNLPIEFVIDYIEQLLLARQMNDDNEYLIKIFHPIIVNIIENHTQSILFPFRVTCMNDSFEKGLVLKHKSMTIYHRMIQLRLPWSGAFIAAFEQLYSPEVKFRELIESVFESIKFNRMEEARHHLLQMIRPIAKAHREDNIKHERINKSLKNFETLQKNNEKLLPGLTSGSYYIDLASENYDWIQETFGKHGEKLKKMDSKDIRKNLKEIIERISSFNSEHSSNTLSDYSPWLSNFRLLSSNPLWKIEIPGKSYKNRSSPIMISNFEEEMLTLNSKCAPRRITMRGNDSKRYMFMVKGGEDLRQDQRIIMLFRLLNKFAKNKKHCVITYSIIPLTTKLGLLEWVDGTTTLKGFIESEMNQMEKNSTNSSRQLYSMFYSKLMDPNKKSLVSAYHAGYNQMTSEQIEEMFKEILETIPPNLLHRRFNRISKNLEQFFHVSTSLAASYAVVSTFQYILGIGDRHLSNFLIHETSGRMLPIDFGMAFDFGVCHQPIPELVPFRYTNQMRYLFQPICENGIFLPSFRATLSTIRSETISSLVLSTMTVFINDPCIDWIGNALRVANRESNLNNSIQLVPSNNSESFQHISKNYVHDRIDGVRMKLKGINPIHILLSSLQNSSLTRNTKENIKRIVIGQQFRVRKYFYDKYSLQYSLSINESVASLVDMATDYDLLGRMYIGWEPFI